MPHALLKDFKSNLPLFVSLILGKIQAFIISYVNAEINKLIQQLLNQCPPPPTLKAITKKVTTLKDVMNKYDKQVEKVEKIPATLEPAIIAGTVIVEILSHMPIPSAVPPGVGVPLGIIQTQSNLLVFTRNMVNALGDDVISINKQVGQVKGIFNPVKLRLQVIESLCARCAENPNLSEDDINELLNASGANVNGGSDTIDREGEQYTASSNGNTYTLLVIQENQEGFGVPRRRAIAKDFRGIVVLKGPLSFAGDTKVLLDELKFRLEQLYSAPTSNLQETFKLPEVDIEFDLKDVDNLLKGIGSQIDKNLSGIEAAQKEAEKNMPITVPKKWSKDKKKGKKKGIYVANKLEEKDKKVWEKVKPFLTRDTINDLFRGKMRRVNHPNIIRN